MKIWLDMDGTIADLYGVADWLPAIRARDTHPFKVARGIGNLALIARLLNKAQKNGHEIGIITLTTSVKDPAYNAKVYAEKLRWLTKHFNSVNWDTILVKPYGTNKKAVCGEGILFDDEEKNRDEWGTGAHEPAEIVEVLKALTR